MGNEIGRKHVFSPTLISPPDTNQLAAQCELLAESTVDLMQVSNAAM